MCWRGWTPKIWAKLCGAAGEKARLCEGGSHMEVWWTESGGLCLGYRKAKAATRRYAGAYPKIQMIFPA